MHFILQSTMRAVCLAIVTMGFALNTHSADLGGHVEAGGSIKDDRHALRSNWELTFVPYLWAFWLDTDQTVQGENVSLNAHLFELLSESDGLNAMPWSSYQELRNGRFAFYGDIQYANVAFSGGQSRGPRLDRRGGRF